MSTTALIAVQRQHGPRAGVLYAAILELGGAVERSCRAWCELLGWSRATFMRAKRALARAGIIRADGAEVLRVEAVSPVTPPVSPVTPRLTDDTPHGVTRDTPRLTRDTLSQEGGVLRMSASPRRTERPAAMTARRSRLTRDTPAGGTRGGGVDQDPEFNSSSSPPPSQHDPGRVARAGAREAGSQEGPAGLDGVELLEAQEADGRCRVAFAGAPPAALRSDLRTAGFRFSPSSRAWVAPATSRSRAMLARFPATEARQPSLPVSRPAPRPSPAIRERPRRPSTPPPVPNAAAQASGQPAWWRPILSQLVDWYGRDQASPLTRAAVIAHDGCVTLAVTDEMDALLIRKNLLDVTTRLVTAGGAGDRVEVQWLGAQSPEASCP